MEANLVDAMGTLGASLTEARSGKALSDRPALEPYRGKPAVRNLRGDRGNVGIIRSPVRASILPDQVRTVGCVPAYWKVVSGERLTKGPHKGRGSPHSYPTSSCIMHSTSGRMRGANAWRVDV